MMSQSRCLKNTFFLAALVFVLAGRTCCQALIPPVVIHTACGFVAGSAGAFAAYPFDFVKSQLQTEVGRAKYSGGMEAAVDIVNTGGPLALYRGVMVNIVGVAPEKTIKLSVNNAARTAIQAHYGYLPILGEVVAGGFAGMMQVTVTNPLEVVKVRMQTSNMTVREVIGQLKHFGDFYQGAGACVTRDVIFSSVLFPLYAHGKVAMTAMIVSLLGNDDGGAGVAGVATSAEAGVTFWANMIAGSLAAAPAAIIATPADVVKTRMQQARKDGMLHQQPTAEKDDDGAGGRGRAGMLLAAVDPPAAVVLYQHQPNFVQVFQHILQDEGPEVLFSGCLERVVRSVPQFGVTLAVFDVLNSMAIQHGLMIAEAGAV
jgi:solute carrier family 25 aspartate/glutamate transporter 12/13